MAGVESGKVAWIRIWQHVAQTALRDALSHLLRPLAIPAHTAASDWWDVGKAMVVVAYSAVWAAPLFAVTSLWLVAWRCNAPCRWIFAAAFAIVCGRWATSLYYGGCAGGKSRFRGIWCAITNPCWWLAMLVLLVVVGAR